MKADKATWPLKFKELGNDPAELYERIEKNTQTVVSFLKANGFTDEEISRLSVVAPKVVLNIIHDYEVVEKKTVDTPDELCGIVKCNNPVCITNNEPMKTIFHVVDKDRGICKCHYCDMEQDMSKVKLC